MRYPTVLFFLSLAATVMGHQGHDEETAMTGSATATATHTDHGNHDHDHEHTSSSYTGNWFNPSNALSYGPSATTLISSAPASPTTVHDEDHTSSQSAPASSVAPQVSSSTAPTVTTPGAVSTTSPAAVLVGTGAANMMYPQVIGVVAGGLMAGLALA
ncbi:hypothetical protein P154DRAFT_624328 [Amniculicola lignicola CBS 123094]|uniref:Uncharacterized protein n=1 Tax=Amniculicola lignicola CBS 123094 TaxID=1392246 RepID=A0A6A5VZD6_9PLEO|nr:hypothetical protein P154DRAFT_624328 [Amniculicola lignicola CBS 123094]